MSMLPDATIASKCCMFLVNQDKYVELKTSGNEKLGLVEDQNMKSTLQELGMKDGSHVVLIHNTHYCLNTTSEKQRKMRQLNDFVAGLYNLKPN